MQEIYVTFLAGCTLVSSGRSPVSKLNYFGIKYCQICEELRQKKQRQILLLCTVDLYLATYDNKWVQRVGFVQSEIILQATSG